MGKYQDRKNFINKKLRGNAKEIFERYIKYMESDYNSKQNEHVKLFNFFRDKQVKDPQGFLDSGVRDMIYAVFKNGFAEKFCNFYLNEMKFMYNHSSYRRSFRSKDIYNYLNFFTQMFNMLFWDFDNFDIVKYTKSGYSQEELREMYFYDNNYINIKPNDSFIEGIIALEIDSGNREIISVLEDIILGENNFGSVSHMIIRSILKSENKELHKLICDLLRAAKLQEGLRQAILESADAGNISAFLMILDLIVQENFVRFSSCIRAVDVWMGLGYDYSDKRIITKLLGLAKEYLSNPEEREKAIENKDSLELYTALWAESFICVENIYPYLAKMMNSDKYKKLVACYFANQTLSENFQYDFSVKFLEEKDIEVFSMVYMNFRNYFSRVNGKYNTERKNSIWSKNNLANTQFEIFINKLTDLPKTEKIISGKPFDFSSIYLTTTQELFFTLLWLADYDESGKNIARLIEKIEYAGADAKSFMIKEFINPERAEIERKILFDSLSDRSMSVRAAALEKIKKLKLKEGESRFIEDLLNLKKGDTRNSCITILESQPKEKILDSIDRLIEDKKENKRLAALDMLDKLSLDKFLDKSEISYFIAKMPKITDKEQIIIDRLVSEEEIIYNFENGFGLFNPNYSVNIPEIKTPKIGISIFKKELKLFKKSKYDKVLDILKAVDDLIFKNKDVTVDTVNWDKSVTTRLIGELDRVYIVDENYVLQDEITAIFEKSDFNALCFLFFTIRLNFYRYGIEQYSDWVFDILNKYFDYNLIQKIHKYINSKEELKYMQLTTDLISNIFNRKYPEVLAHISLDSINTLVDNLDEEDWKRKTHENTDNYYLQKNRLNEIQIMNIFKGAMKIENESEEDFINRFALFYKGLKKLDISFFEFNEMDICRAIKMELLPIDALYERFFVKEKQYHSLINTYTGGYNYERNKEKLKDYPFFEEVKEKSLNRILEIELKRGDSPTLVTHLAQGINNHFGIENFINILLALGDETLARGYIYNQSTKKEVLSKLLRGSKPLPTDNAEIFAEFAKGRISEKRLLEAAMYCPSWLPVIEEYLKFKNLRLSSWYFIAHTGEARGVDFDSEIVKYTPISKEEFRDGAFDLEWFKRAYKAIGAEKFQLLYDCAKYISDGASHRRSQIFADATLNKLKADDVILSVTEKRNKESLLAYSLLPLKRNKDKDAIERFEFIQNFLKESKKFGAQRKASEAKVCEIALSNLARNYGYNDIIRFTWKMEILKLDQINQYFQPKTVDNVELYISVDEKGTASIVCLKDGKALKSVPAKLKKDPYVEELKKIKTSLVDQQKRAKKSLESAMENADEFLAEEILDLLKHPVIMPIVSKLVFRFNDALGFITSEGLKTLENKIIEFKKDDKVLIAHCYDLFILKKWSDYQKYAFENELVQPFKQIFRELYTLNEDEKHEKTLSRRYAGHQVQPSRTLALLKTRNWTANYDEGLQKVYYKQNIIVTIYAMADWFSPADIEAPTLEYVRFYDRLTNKIIELENIPPNIFSESMRDVDLVVSVAHVGGVDPETSLSTIEMRAMIMKEIVSLLKLENVEIREKHAIVKGFFGEFSVHLGSGIVSKQGTGTLSILAVQSQHRGRLFLPFIDEDPRTAEIASKVLMLAEDKKIKDPTIIDQLKK